MVENISKSFLSMVTSTGKANTTCFRKMKRGKREYIEKSLKYLLPLAEIPKNKRSSFVPLLSDNCIHKICESCQNLLQNTYKFDKKKLKLIKKKLTTSPDDMRSLSKPTSSLLRKRRILSTDQAGSGIFSLLATTIIPALIGAIAK